MVCLRPEAVEPVEQGIDLCVDESFVDLGGGERFVKKGPVFLEVLQNRFAVPIRRRSFRIGRRMWVGRRHGRAVL